jgi:uncharacterized membrane protein
MDFTLSHAIEWAGKVVDATGVVVIIVGMLSATALYVTRWRRKPAVAQFRAYRQTVGRAIVLGLEFLLGGDIIRTVAVDPTFRSVGVLSIIVAIRTFFSLELELEIDGRFPWQPGDTAAATGSGTGNGQS